MVELIQSAKDTRMLMVGDTIEDVYHYVTPLGRSTKDVYLSTELKKTEVFNGGIEAAAQYGRTICKVDTWSACSVTKERWIEQAHHRKLFQVQKPLQKLEKDWPKEQYDLIAAIDFGHGPSVRSWDTDFFALNVQTNSANYGFNLLKGDDGADYLMMNELEARLATQRQHSPMLNVLEDLRKYSPKIVITMGRDGAIGWSATDGICVSPSITSGVIDTMGAGDCFFAVTAPLAKRGTIQQLLQIGNAAAALKTQIKGHGPISKECLLEYLNR